MKKNMAVVVGIVKNLNGEILLGLRPDGSFMAGFWELPGGKVEPGETPKTALKRELLEELDIKAAQLCHRLDMHYEYPDRVVNISVFDITSYQNVPTGHEGQSLAWLQLSTLKNNAAQYPLLPTMSRIINSLTLQTTYWITPQGVSFVQIEQQLKQGIKQIQLRLKDKTIDYQTQLTETQKLTQQYGGVILLNHPCSLDNPKQHIHLSSLQLMNLKARPIDDKYLLGASVHNQAELTQAHKIGADFAVLSPILTTTSHPTAKPLGWDEAQQFILSAKLPVYCLGGLQKHHLTKANTIGAIGIAGISQL